jgi:hypothetical protein
MTTTKQTAYTTQHVYPSSGRAFYTAHCGSTVLNSGHHYPNHSLALRAADLHNARH